MTVIMVKASHRGLSMASTEIKLLRELRAIRGAQPPIESGGRLIFSKVSNKAKDLRTEADCIITYSKNWRNKPWKKL